MPAQCNQYVSYVQPWRKLRSVMYRDSNKGYSGVAVRNHNCVSLMKSQVRALVAAGLLANDPKASEAARQSALNWVL